MTLDRLIDLLETGDASYQDYGIDADKNETRLWTVWLDGEFQFVTVKNLLNGESVCYAENSPKFEAIISPEVCHGGY